MDVLMKVDLREPSFDACVAAVKKMITDRGLTADQVHINDQPGTFVAYEWRPNGFMAVVEAEPYNGSYGHIMVPLS